MRKVLSTMGLVCLILSAAGSVFAQTSNGQIGGVVQDPSRALIPGVTVTLTNTETGVTAAQLTNETGVYNFVSVPPGTYRVTLDDLVDLFLGVKVFVNAGTAREVVVRKCHISRMEIASVPAW